MKRFFVAIALIFAMAVPAFSATAPTFPGGEDAMKKYIQENLKYPAMAKENGIEGIVNVAFTVKADGSVGSIKIVRMIDPDLEQEAIRLVKNMPLWTPAEEGGAPVDATATVSIPFILE